MKPGNVADCTSLISSKQQAPGMRHCERLMRNPEVIVFCVCSQANMEHVAAVRESGGLQGPVQSCQIHFRPLTAVAGGRPGENEIAASVQSGRGALIIGQEYEVELQNDPI